MDVVIPRCKERAADSTASIGAVARTWSTRNVPVNVFLQVAATPMPRRRLNDVASFDGVQERSRHGIGGAVIPTLKRLLWAEVVMRVAAFQVNAVVTGFMALDLALYYDTRHSDAASLALHACLS